MLQPSTSSIDYTNPNITHVGSYVVNTDIDFLTLLSQKYQKSDLISDIHSFSDVNTEISIIKCETTKENQNLPDGVHLIPISDIDYLRTDNPKIIIKMNKDSTSFKEEYLHHFFSDCDYSFSEDMWVNSKSTSNGVFGLFSSHRKSKQLNLYTEFSCNELTAFLNENKLVQSPKGWSVLRYKKGDFF